MALQLQHKVYPTFLKVKVKGSRTPGKEVEEIVMIWSTIAGLCEEHGLIRILAVLNIKGRIPLESAYRMQESFRKTGWKPEYKLAIIANADTLVVNILLSEKVWADLGHTMKLFSQERSGRKWLLS